MQSTSWHRRRGRQGTPSTQRHKRGGWRPSWRTMLRCGLAHRWEFPMARRGSGADARGGRGIDTSTLSRLGLSMDDSKVESLSRTLGPASRQVCRGCVASVRALAVSPMFLVSPLRLLALLACTVSSAPPPPRVVAEANPPSVTMSCPFVVVSCPGFDAHGQQRPTRAQNRWILCQVRPGE
jgi:hypothetical protein